MDRQDKVRAVSNWSGHKTLAILPLSVINPTQLSERQEQHHQPTEAAEVSVDHQLVEFDRLDAEWQELIDLHSAAKELLYGDLSGDLAARLPELEQELARVHRRQHEVIDLQEALEISILRAKGRK